MLLSKQMEKIKVVEYLQDGVSVFGKWFSGLDGEVAATVATTFYTDWSKAISLT